MASRHAALVLIPTLLLAVLIHAVLRLKGGDKAAHISSLVESNGTKAPLTVVSHKTFKTIFRSVSCLKLRVPSSKNSD
jgi:hypothetical protein